MTREPSLTPIPALVAFLKSLPQLEWERRTGIAQTTISSYATGRSQPSLSNLARLAAAIKLSDAKLGAIVRDLHRPAQAEYLSIESSGAAPLAEGGE